jgi:[ribosomal protein S5]-alanine N-acetyltransferase
MQILETERLRLRRLTPDDAPFILELLNDPLFLRFVGDKGVRDRAGAEQYLRQGPMASYAQHGFGLFHVALRDGDVPIGMCGLLKREILQDVDIGFAYLPQFGGQGYATEAAQGVMHYGRTVLGLKRIVAITAPDNEASQNVLKKIGLRYDRTLQLPAYKDDSFLFTPAAD